MGIQMDAEDIRHLISCDSWCFVLIAVLLNSDGISSRASQTDSYVFPGQTCLIKRSWLLCFSVLLYTMVATIVWNAY